MNWQNTGLREEEVNAINRILSATAGVEKAVLYGSRAKGNYRPGSDIDLVLKGEQLNHNDLLAIEIALDNLLLPYEIDLSLFHHIDNADLIAHIDRVGKVVFQRDSSV